MNLNINNINNRCAILFLLFLIILILFPFRNYTFDPIKLFNPNLTIIDVFKNIAHDYPSHPALKVYRVSKNKRHAGKWKTITFRTYFNMCSRFANSLLALGLDNSSSVCIIGHNAPGWFIAHLGSLMAGVKSVGIYSSNLDDACAHIVNNCRPIVLVVENSLQLRKFMPILLDSKHCPIQFIVSYGTSIDSPLSLPIYTFNQFLHIGSSSSFDPFISNNHVATIIYTSGSTGHPKGVVLTHHNLSSITNSMIRRLNSSTSVHLQMANERIVSYLPLNHIAAQLLDIYLPVVSATTVWLADPLALKSSLKRTLCAAKPTIFAAVPRVWEKIMENIQSVKMNKSIIERGIFDFTAHFATYFKRAIIRQIGLDQCQYQISTAAPISQSVKDFFADLCLPLYDVYGMSETTGPVSVSIPDANRYGSVGKLLDHVKIKIKNNEILLKGPALFAGYFNNPDTCLDQSGWFYTGDTGYLDKDKFLFITGRTKDIIITAGGENISPLNIESHIKDLLPLVEHAVVIGDQRKFLSLLLTFKLHTTTDGDSTILFTDLARSILNMIGSNATTIISALDDKSIQRYINNGIKTLNRSAVSNAHTIKKWILLPHSFTVSGGELTPTMKIKRSFINHKYKALIQSLYLSSQ